MTSRAGRPDTPADIEIRSALDNVGRPPFVVTAGAGSGKTTSLIKALTHIVGKYGKDLRSRNQRIACITYTQIAADEIHDDVGNDPLVQVCTIHSFLWDLVRPFYTDIREWVKTKLDADIEELSGKQYGPRVSQATKDKDTLKLTDFQEARQHLEGVSSFVYGTGSDYAKGILGHEDILNIAPDLIKSRPLLVKIVARRFPFILIDESQDTFENVVSALKHIHQDSDTKISLGFFGDPMQSIYQRGAGEISLDIGWIPIAKPENYRSSTKVLEVVNAVRRGGDSLVQVHGKGDKDTPEGEAFFFVLPANGDRIENLRKVRAWLERHSSNSGWTDSAENDRLKILTIVHRMVARRLGFDGLYSAFNDNGSSLNDDFREGTAWPLAPLRTTLLPLIQASSTSESQVIDIIRKNSTLFSVGMKGDEVKNALQKAIEAVEAVRVIANEDQAGSVGLALRLAIDSEIILPDPHFTAFLSREGVYDGVENSESTVAVLSALMGCKLSEIQNYQKYIEEESPYSTQHGTKGSEFDKVIVILDDDEGQFWQYSFEKYLGIKPLTQSDEKNVQEGKETVVDRTRRLFYVCVSRAITSLSVLLFTEDVETGVTALRKSGITGSARILTLTELD